MHEFPDRRPVSDCISDASDLFMAVFQFHMEKIKLAVRLFHICQNIGKLSSCRIYRFQLDVLQIIHGLIICFQLIICLKITFGIIPQDQPVRFQKNHFQCLHEISVMRTFSSESGVRCGSCLSQQLRKDPGASGFQNMSSVPGSCPIFPDHNFHSAA